MHHSRPLRLLSNLRRHSNLNSSRRVNHSKVNSSHFQLAVHLRLHRSKVFSHLHNSSILPLKTSIMPSLTKGSSSSMVVVATSKEVSPITIKAPISLLTWTVDPTTMVDRTWCLPTSKGIKMVALVWTPISTTNRRASIRDLLTRTGTTIKVVVTRCLCQSLTLWPCRRRRMLRRLSQTDRNLSPLDRAQKLQWCQLDKIHSPTYSKSPSNLPTNSEGEKASR